MRLRPEADFMSSVLLHQTCQPQKPKMSVTNFKMSEKMSVKAISRLYHGYFTFYHHFQAFQGHGNILMSEYQVGLNY